MSGFRTFWDPDFDSKSRFVSHISNISSFLALALFFHTLFLSWTSLLLSSCLLSYVILHLLASEHLSFQASEWPRRVTRNTNNVSQFSKRKMYQNSCCIVCLFSRTLYLLWSLCMEASAMTNCVFFGGKTYFPIFCWFRSFKGMFWVLFPRRLPYSSPTWFSTNFAFVPWALNKLFLGDSSRHS